MDREHSVSFKGSGSLYCEMDDNGELHLRLVQDDRGNYWPAYVSRAQARELQRWLAKNLDETA